MIAQGVPVTAALLETRRSAPRVAVTGTMAVLNAETVLVETAAAMPASERREIVVNTLVSIDAVVAVTRRTVPVETVPVPAAIRGIVRVEHTVVVAVVAAIGRAVPVVVLRPCARDERTAVVVTFGRPVAPRAAAPEAVLGRAVRLETARVPAPVSALGGAAVPSEGIDGVDVPVGMLAARMAVLDGPGRDRTGRETDGKGEERPADAEARAPARDGSTSLHSRCVRRPRTTARTIPGRPMNRQGLTGAPAPSLLERCGSPVHLLRHAGLLGCAPWVPCHEPRRHPSGAGIDRQAHPLRCCVADERAGGS
jgi:hypothetical protein